MLRITVALLGFAVFGAMFAAAYYQPSEVERELPTPKFRLAPGEMVPDFIEPGAQGELVTVNLTVLQGGPVDAYLMNMENLTLNALNGTTYGFEIGDNVSYNPVYSRTNISATYNFTFIADGQNRTALLIASRMPFNASHPAENRYTPENTTEVSVTMRYTATEQRSLVIGYLMATPSVLLISYVLYRHAREVLEARGGDGGGPSG
ncbi:MAG: hypothetical protein R3185_00095 [Candidatus Thermoplasmatota archaeon]|nr:hypothetical protein [Candidatus Thermoplasmatota archaeon]